MPLLDQELDERVPMGRLLGLDHIEVIHVPISGQVDRKIEVPAPLEAGRIPRGPLAPQIVPGVDVLELGAQHSRRADRPGGC